MNLRIIAIALLFVPLPVLADSDEGGEHGDRDHGIGAVTHAATLEECSACHIAYQPGFLPVRSWTAIMATLGDHFGEDASVDEASRAEIEAYLVGNAADAGGSSRTLRGVDADATPLRISELPWFVREHEGEVSRTMMEKAKSMSNCAACHTGAERGMFDDD